MIEQQENVMEESGQFVIGFITKQAYYQANLLKTPTFFNQDPGLSII